MADLYEVLGVRADASEDGIRKAYRSAARREHPDVSGHPDAAARMMQVNEAFAVLSDPAARAGYDRSRWLPPLAVEQEQPDEGTADYAWLACERCGMATDDLRFRVFSYVLSLGVTNRRTTAGLFCRRCRRKLARSRSLISLLCGPWGIPGPVTVLRAVYRNARGGGRNAMVDSNFEAHLRRAGRGRGPVRAPLRRRRRLLWGTTVLLLLSGVGAGVVVAVYGGLTW
jgi:curved DNA-binding protein CbpA